MHKTWLSIAAMLLAAFSPAVADSQDDAGTGMDAGDSFETATPLPVHGRFDGRLEPESGDVHDFFSFPVDEGQAFSVIVTLNRLDSDLFSLLDPTGQVVDVGTKKLARGIGHSNVLTAASSVFSPSNEHDGVRLSVHRATMTGRYRLHLKAETTPGFNYSICAMNCDQVRSTPIELIFGGSLKDLDTKVLLVPPMHGDLGDPSGPTVLDYIQATVDGIKIWEPAIDAFVAKYPQFSYLDEIEVTIEIFDELNPVDPVGYDVVIGYVAAGPAFRGVATDAGGVFIQDILPGTHYSGRYIALSLFGSSPRAGQVMYDFPEVMDLKNVTAHEFGHTFGLGHTTTWHPVLGADLMNSPASFIYGNGATIGDGGERTAEDCLSSLNLLGMAELYRWVPDGAWRSSGGWVSLPGNMPYEWFC
jgi:hypothetical protein